MEQEKKSNKRLKSVGFIIFMVLIGIGAFQFLRTENVVEDYNNYRKEVQKSALKISKAGNALTAISTDANIELDEFKKQYESKVLATYKEAIDILEKGEPETEEVKKFKKIVVDTSKEQYELLEELLVAVEEDDEAAAIEINDKIYENVVKFESEVKKFQDNLEKEYDVEFDKK